jgi:ribosomal protein S18 acetylase RimI-like enzyme
MVDMLVRLYALPENASHEDDLKAAGIIIRRAHPAETEVIASWVDINFQAKWAAEVRGSLEHRPTTCFIAVELQPVTNLDDDPYNQPTERLIGFACYDITAKGMFGPEGVHPDYRGRGIGKALLLAGLRAMAVDGYAYAIIGWAGPTAFYEKTVGAVLIENSEPGIFRGSLKGE